MSLPLFKVGTCELWAPSPPWTVEQKKNPGPFPTTDFLLLLLKTHPHYLLRIHFGLPNRTAVTLFRLALNGGFVPGRLRKPPTFLSPHLLHTSFFRRVSTAAAETSYRILLSPVSTQHFPESSQRSEAANTRNFASCNPYNRWQTL